MDRNFSARANHEKAKLKAGRKRRSRITIGVVIVAIAAAGVYVWATTLCGDCGGLAILPTPG
jgi:hypothetical protein